MIASNEKKINKPIEIINNKRRQVIDTEKNIFVHPCICPLLNVYHSVRTLSNVGSCPSVISPSVLRQHMFVIMCACLLNFQTLKLFWSPFDDFISKTYRHVIDKTIFVHPCICRRPLLNVCHSVRTLLNVGSCPSVRQVVRFASTHVCHYVCMLAKFLNCALKSTLTSMFSVFPGKVTYESRKKRAENGLLSWNEFR